ncbi:hypothetical protein AGABI2DRAFT_77669 [Agaricus bisporus var. bisporus H97]|uniref:hypothetical protein n=1 Tax=Agaricus bisporus var. bisporus (strain H97 / ATCC MYA-4626 / FGSC 10389) TaxID=936046 RepID=UPI00029F5678|nr:hypothetical protein AGABI2DRAFT_77669 [Agaricus bisporus var. bisporus H97]EKV43010.1 hypothetical protein AGABI2DRAFT_77669 [Agaricus bisporus var. bisporus H97]
MGLSRKYILLFLAALLVFTGISIIYSQPSLLRHAGQLISEDSKCFRPASYDHVDLIGPADSITLEKPVTLHDYRDDGLLWVSSTASHPIHDLIADAANKWLIKNSVASRNLRDAVGEYRRRYGRLPPKGFDKWWEYVQEYNVQLPDEYDQIWHDIEPFWGFDPVELRRLQLEQEAKPDSITIGKGENTPITILNETLRSSHLRRVLKDILPLLKPIEEHIPPFRAVISPHDNPSRLFDYDLKQAALRAAKSNKYLTEKDLPPTSFRGWMTACPESQHERTPSGKGIMNKTFIHDHRQTMDPCTHPKLLGTHGQFLRYGNLPPPPGKVMVPRFSFCASTLHYDIRMPSLLSWMEEIHPAEFNPEWDNRTDHRLVWRGTNTGMRNTAETKWRETQRPRTVDFANDMEGEVNVLFPPAGRDDPVGEGRNVSKSKINPAVFDIAFAGEPLQCEKDYCGEIAKMYDWRKYQNTRGASVYKYVLDVDGNGWSSRFQRLMISNALIFKATIYPEWFLDRIQPWVHYVPVQVDLSDLHDALLFFRGDLYGEGSHHELARKIAHEGREWAKRFWRKEDMTAYAFRLMLEYARVMSPERDSMSFSV